MSDKKVTFKSAEQSMSPVAAVPKVTNDGPKTIREIQAEKVAKKKLNKELITIQNVSKQIISIHLNPPQGVDFYFGAEDKPIRPNQVASLNRSRVRMDQLKRLQQTGFISIISDSAKDDVEDQKKVTITKLRQ